MLDNGKTSNVEYNTVVTRWNSGKVIGPSSVGLFILDSIFHPRNERAGTGATLGPFLFLGLLKYHLLNFRAEEHLLVLWKSVYRFPETHQEVVCRVPVLMPIAYCIRSSFFLSISIIASSNAHLPILGLVLRWATDRDISDGAGVCIDLSAEEHSATKSSSILVQLSFSGSVDSRSSCLDLNCRLLSIFLALEVRGAADK